MARGCLQGVKYLMFAFNLLFWLGGCGVLGVGIWLAATQGNFATLSSSFPSLSAANLLIVTGTFVMAIGFVGCIGALKENKCLLLTFFVLLLLVFLLEATIAVLFFAYSDKVCCCKWTDSTWGAGRLSAESTRSPEIYVVALVVWVGQQHS